MKHLFCFLCLSLTFVLPPDAFSKSPPVLNRIEGVVYDENHVPVPDAYVELLNELDSLLARDKTSSSGRFSFFGISSGHFRIKVLPLGKDLMEQSQDVDVVNIVSSSDVVFVDFYLKPYKRPSSVVWETPPDAIFVQDIPQDARKLYESGVKDLAKNKSQGLSEIEEAIKIFPDYFDALSRLGREYISRKDYTKGYGYLLKAIDINARSFSSYYSLSYAFYQLGEISAAIKAAQATITLNASSPDAHLLYGTLLRINGDYQESEKVLLKSIALAKKPNSEVHWQLALLYNKTNRNKDAAAELETFLKISPNSPDKKKVEDLISKLKSSKQN